MGEPRSAIISDDRERALLLTALFKLHGILKVEHCPWEQLPELLKRDPPGALLLLLDTPVYQKRRGQLPLLNAESFHQISLLDHRLGGEKRLDGKLPEGWKLLKRGCLIQQILAALPVESVSPSSCIAADLPAPCLLGGLFPALETLHFNGRMEIQGAEESLQLFFHEGAFLGLSDPYAPLSKDPKLLNHPTLIPALRLLRDLGGEAQEEQAFQLQHIQILSGLESFQRRCAQLLAPLLLQEVEVRISPLSLPPPAHHGVPSLSLLHRALGLLSPHHLSQWLGNQNLHCPPLIPKPLQNLLSPERYAPLFARLSQRGHPQEAARSSGLRDIDALSTLVLMRLLGLAFASRPGLPPPLPVLRPESPLAQGPQAVLTSFYENTLDLDPDELPLPEALDGGFEMLSPPPTPKARLTGTRLWPLHERFGPFHLGYRLRGDGMRELLLARRAGRNSQGLLLLKRLRALLYRKPEFIKRLKLEGELNARFQHPGLPKLLEQDRVGRRHYLLFEFVHGVTLDALMAKLRGRGLPYSWLSYLASKLSEVLVYLESQRRFDGRGLQLLHRDLCPQNILLGFNSEIKLLRLGETAGSPRRLPGRLIYSAPESFDENPLDVRSDLFSLGALLYELYSGRSCFRRENPKLSLAALRKGEFSPLLKITPLSRIIESCLQVQPARRPPSALALFKRLKRDCPSPDGVSEHISQNLKRLFSLTRYQEREALTEMKRDR